MPNIFEPDGRGASTGVLALRGVVFLAVLTVVGGLLVAKSQGLLDRRVQVTALLSSVGDGLPRKSDVKYRGVLVGMVRNVTPAIGGGLNVVEIDLTPQYARTIPATVTARIVPSNAFAVSSVQLVDNGTGRPIRSGDTVGEDRSLPAQLFQTTLAKLRELVSALTRPDGDRTIGLIRAIADATAERGPQLTSAAGGLNRIVAEMNDLSVDTGEPAMLQTWDSAITALRGTAPELVDALHDAVLPMQTVAERQADLSALLTGSRDTVGTVGTALENRADQMLAISTQLTPVLGVLADNSAKYPAIGVSLNNVVDKFFAELWTRTGKKLSFTFKLVVALAPLRVYTRADCPAYGELRGASCDTAPEVEPVFDFAGMPDMRSYTPPPGITLPADPDAAAGAETPQPDTVADELLLTPLNPPPPAPTFDPTPEDETAVGTP